MGRSFYKDEEDKYSTPGLPTVQHIAEPETPSANTTTEIKVNKFGNLITTSPALERFASKIRETATDYYECASEKYDFYTGTASSHFAMTVDKVAQFKGQDEELLPNICAVLTSTLVGSIVARNRSLPIRFFSPVLFGALALKYSLPQTYNNLSTGLQNVGLAVERKNFPEFKETRERSCEQLHGLCNSIQQFRVDSWNSLVSTVACTRQSVCSSLKSLKKD